MADVFLSYSQKDREAVERVAGGLKALGLSVWYDARLDSGGIFDEIINGELREAKAVLVCWTPDSIASKWARAEAMFGYDKHKLAACFLRACELSPPFNLVHTSDLSDWDGRQAHAGWRSVARSLGKRCGRPGVGALAEALAIGSHEAVSSWARDFPEEPLAREMWAAREARLRHEFATGLKGASVALRNAIEERRLAGEAALGACSQAFEEWLRAERSGTAGDQPDPAASVRASMEGRLTREDGAANELLEARRALAAASNERAANAIELDRLKTGLDAARATLAALKSGGNALTAASGGAALATPGALAGTHPATALGVPANAAFDGAPVPNDPPAKSIAASPKALWWLVIPLSAIIVVAVLALLGRL